MLQYLQIGSPESLMPLYIPERYLEDAHDRIQGSTHTAQLFRLSTEDYRPVTRRETSQLMKDKDADYFTFVLRNFRPLEQILQFNLDGWNSDYFQNPRPYEVIEHQAGLWQVVGDFEPEDRTIFLELDQGGIDAVISCPYKQDWHRRLPRCEAFLNASGIDVSMTFAQEKIEIWGRLRRSVVQFVSCISVF